MSSALGFAPDADLVREISMSEMVVLPYRFMHNSGAVLLALSLDRPVLVPDNEVNRLLEIEVGSDWVHDTTEIWRCLTSSAHSRCLGNACRGNRRLAEETGRLWVPSTALRTGRRCSPRVLVEPDAARGRRRHAVDGIHRSAWCGDHNGGPRRSDDHPDSRGRDSVTASGAQRVRSLRNGVGDCRHWRGTERFRVVCGSDPGARDYQGTAIQLVLDQYGYRMRALRCPGRMLWARSQTSTEKPDWRKLRSLYRLCSS